MCFDVVSRKLQRSFKQVSREFQKDSKEVSSVFHGSFKDVSRVFKECLKKSFKGVSCFQSVSKVLQKRFTLQTNVQLSLTVSAPAQPSLLCYKYEI